MIAAPNKDLTLAFAGVFQSATLVYQIAKLERFDEQALHESAYSLLRLDSENTEQIYGSVFGLDLGLRAIIRAFSSKPDQSTRDIYQYAAATHQLSRKLFRLHNTSDIIQTELREIQIDYLDRYEDHLSRGDLYEELSTLYSKTISLLTPRIIVQGASEKLQRPETVNQVRTALFAGIRSAYLWHQLGGRRWQLLFNRNQYIALCKDLIR